MYVRKMDHVSSQMQHLTGKVWPRECEWGVAGPLDVCVESIFSCDCGISPLLSTK